MAWILLAVCVTCKVLGALCALIGWRLYVYKHRKGDIREHRFEITLTVGPTESGETGNNCPSDENIAAEVHGNQSFEASNPALVMENGDMKLWPVIASQQLQITFDKVSNFHYTVSEKMQ